MVNLFVELSKYILIMCIAFYTLNGFLVFRYSDENDRNGFYLTQNFFMIAIHFIGFMVLALTRSDNMFLVYYVVGEVLILGVMILYRVIYKGCNKLIINNMFMLISISFIMLARLSFDKFIKQFIIVFVSLLCSLAIPALVKYIKPAVANFKYIYAVCSVMILALVLIIGQATYGSKISFTIQGITFQPSEVIKIIFVLFMAAMLNNAANIKNIVVSAIFALMHILVLVLSRDLGSALIFFIVYIMMLYVSTCKLRYLFLGLISGSAGGFLGFKLFSHVRTRVTAWLEPFAYIDGQGYQITQSLFAMGTGGWFGMGLDKGAPNKIPVVEADFIFSAISEELGCLFSIFLILICMSNFLMFMNIAMRIKDNFYKLTAMGLAVIYGFQIFLTIGGVTKFIPLTGVTLPLVSYGGTSVLVTIIMFSIIQGIYVLKDDEHENAADNIYINANSNSQAAMMYESRENGSNIINNNNGYTNAVYNNYYGNGAVQSDFTNNDRYGKASAYGNHVNNGYQAESQGQFNAAAHNKNNNGYHENNSEYDTNLNRQNYNPYGDFKA